MKQSEQNYISSKMAVLKGEKLFYTGRLAASGDFGFGVKDEKDYCLHIQTAFRLRTDKEILIANLDMFKPTEKLEGNPSFDWDVKGSNRYDEWTKKYNKDKDNYVVVENIFVNDFGDLTIKCSNNIIIEIFMNASNDECWRFFERTSKDDHLVVTGKGIEK